MMGITIDGVAHIYVHNMPVIHNTSKTKSVLKKTNNVVCNHIVHESVDMRDSLTAQIDGHDNHADTLTKVQCGWKQRYLVKNIL